MSELGIDGQLGMCFNEKTSIEVNCKDNPLSVKEINEEARLVHICGYPKIEVSFTRIQENIRNHMLFLMSVRFILEDLKE